MTAAKSDSSKSLTPLMRQYYGVKKKHPDKVLLFRMGDFYETFDEDAKISSRVLGITLTKRSNGAAGETPLAGFPHHALDSYLHKLLKAGLKVAICEQLEDPRQAKGIVKRDITEIVTPGTAVNDKFLNASENNFLGTFHFNDENNAYCYCDVSTGLFHYLRGSRSTILNFVESDPPSEILCPDGRSAELKKLLPYYRGLITELPDWVWDPVYARDLMGSQFKVQSLRGLGLSDSDETLPAIGATIHYLRENFQQSLSHMTGIQQKVLDDIVGLDQYTIRNLEIFRRLSGETGEGTLIWALDYTMGNMGSRHLRQWILQPLKKQSGIEDRLNKVEAFFEDASLREKLRAQIRDVADLERLSARLGSAKLSPRDALTLADSAERALLIQDLLSDHPEFHYQDSSRIQSMIDYVRNTIEEDAPAQVSDGAVFKVSCHPDLKELRQIARHGRDYLIKLQEQERLALGISSLKIAYNKVFGYYIEITHAHKDKVPEHYIRKQTLTNAERYITPELKVYEEKISSAEDKLISLELKLFNEFIAELQNYIPEIQDMAVRIASADILSAFAELARRNRWVRPQLRQDTLLKIRSGRHPVIEALLPPGERFVPNDLSMDTDKQQILIITGPNMAGKSTYLRQIGIITLLAHIGSFVPADAAEIGLVDKIFTRVGASDNLAFGESTFLTEMIETANILNTASSRSLILLDEIGRGTSTYDGLSIAWAVIEYLHNNENVAARTLFATHYHELTELEKLLPGVKNFNVAIREYGDSIVFLRKIIPGGADKSYGIYVAQMAGIPGEIIHRANDILFGLSSADHSLPDGRKVIRPGIREEKSLQLSIFEAEEHAVLKTVKDLNVDNMTPLQALQALDELKKKL